MKRPISKLCLLPIADNHLPATHQASAVEELKDPDKPSMTNAQLCAIRSDTKPTMQQSCGRARGSKPRVSTPTTCLMILANLLVIYSTANTQPMPFTVTPFTSQSGLYFEDMGQVNIVNNEWKLIIYCNLENYWLELDGYRNITQRMEGLCEKISNDTVLANLCQALLMQFHHHLTIIDHNNELLKIHDQPTTRKVRSKRGLINAVGSLANNLFGVLDQTYAEHYENQIKEIQQNEGFLHQLIINQTSVVEATSNIIKKTEQKITEQVANFNKHLDVIKFRLNQMDYSNMLLESAQNFNFLALEATLMMIGYESLQKDLLNMVINIKNGAISLRLLTPSQLIDQLAVIRRYLPPDLKLPYDESSSQTRQLYQLMSTEARVTKKNFIIRVKIPLPYREEYQLFHLIPVPTRHENKFVFIEPSSTHLIVNLLRNNYYGLSEEELHRCKYLSNQQYLCEQHHPIYNTESNISRCEIDLLNHVSTLSPFCNLRSTNPSRTWTQLHKTNNWVYSVDEVCTLNIICNTGVFPVTLEGNGIIGIEPKCIINERTMQIKTHNLYPSELRSSFMPSTNLSAIIGNTLNRTNGSVITLPHVKFEPSRDMTALNVAIKELKQHQERPLEVSHHDIHHYATTYIMIIVGITIVVWYVIKKMKRTRSPPTPPPRFHVPDIDTETIPLRHPVTRGENVQSQPEQ